MPAHPDTKLHHALAAGDHTEVVRLYTAAADEAEQDQRLDEACFFLTQGWILALHHDLAVAGGLQKRLSEHGRV